MTPLVRMVREIAAALLHPGELDTVEEEATTGGVRVDIIVRGTKAVGAVIGQAGETISAIRHLARRVGKAHPRQYNTPIWVEVRNLEEKE